MAQRVYTRTGDKGQTTLADGTRISKTDVRIEAIGTIDELNANIGLLMSEINNDETTHFLEQIQLKLFTIGNIIGNSGSCEPSTLSEKEITNIEEETDRLNNSLPTLNNFVMPRGNREVAMCHVCRTVCRRAERRILAIENIEKTSPQILAYINRLSDYLFVLSRNLNNIDNREEKILPISCE